MTEKRTVDGPGRLARGGARTPDELAVAALVSQLSSASPDDLAVERVWRRVNQTERAAWTIRRPALWVPVVALGALLALVLALPAWRAHPAAVELTLSSGGVFSSKLGEDWRAGHSGEALAEAERVRTDATGRAVLRLRGVAAMLLGEDSDVVLERLGSGTFVRLERGTLTSRVAKRKPNEPFVVQTERYSVKVVGTLFTVEEGPGLHTAVSVREGIVEVSDGLGHVERVVAGQRWTSEAAERRTPDQTPDAVRNLLEDGLGERSVADLAGDFVATVERPKAAPLAVPAPPVAMAKEPAHKREAAPVRSHSSAQTVAAVVRGAEPVHETAVAPTPVLAPPLVAAPEPPLPSAPARMEPPVAASPVLVAPVAVVPTPEPVAEPVPSPAPVVQATDTPSYARGRALEAKGDLEGAAKELGLAAETDPLHGDLALYTLGRLAQRRLHDVKRARAAFTSYRERYPRGPLMPEVDLAMLEIEVETHAKADALADSTRFLAAHPGSERIDEVHLLRGNLLRDEGSCREALDDYASVRRGALADDALYSTAYCQRKLGDRLAATKTLNDYLARFPAGAHRVEAQQALEEGAAKEF